MLALIWANSPWSESYTALTGLTVGPAALHLDLTLGQWAAGGLLAVFFFVAGLELKREFVAGDLRDPRRAALPVAAAVGGMAVPALVYLAINSGTGGDALTGLAIPTATDIAFALAVLAVIGTHLPAALRAFLLTLAVGFTVSLLIGELPSARAASRRTTSRWPCSSGRWWPPCSPRSSCGSATGTTGCCARPRNATPTPTVSPTSTRAASHSGEPDRHR